MLNGNARFVDLSEILSLIAQLQKLAVASAELKADALQMVADGDGNRRAEAKANQHGHQHEKHIAPWRVSTNRDVHNLVVVWPNISRMEEIVGGVRAIEEGMDHRLWADFAEPRTGQRTGIHNPADQGVETQHRVECRFEVSHKSGQGIHIGAVNVVGPHVLENGVYLVLLVHHFGNVESLESLDQVVVHLQAVSTNDQRQKERTSTKHAGS
mmetsp:Transcript_55124/g.129411  ORF Transcript_55124/g.129411 Transcript_55124/m.129411 type:complete len:212 (+) Transcript_55124:333-968(+)